MIVYVYVLCHNEEKIIPFFLDHYLKFADKITVFDNESTDKSAELYRNAGCTVIPWSCGEGFHDGYHMQIKQKAYKESRGIADWVMVLDNDEFIYHPNIKEQLWEYDKQGINVPKISGFDMVSEAFPLSSVPIIEQVTSGVPMSHLSKRVVFKPHLEMHWGVGCHPQDLDVSKMIPGARESKEADFKLLHYKLLSKQYVKDRYAHYRTRLSYFNHANQFGTHYLQSDQELDRQFDEFYMPNRIKVL